MAAALVLGAEGVQTGTRMVSAAESPVHANWKQLICTLSEGDTLLLNCNSPPAFRVLRTEFSESAERDARAVTPKLESVRDLYFGGNMEASFAFSGQVAGRIKGVLPWSKSCARRLRSVRACCARQRRATPNEGKPMKRWALVAVCGFVALAGCSSSSSSKAANAQPATTVAAAPATTTSSAPATPDTQVWLCKPGLAHNPCLTSLDSTSIGPDGTKTVTNTAAAADPKIDCFYVYPTVSEQPTPSATLAIDPAEVGVAVAEAARYSQTCRVYAPIYRQGTIAWMTKSGADFGTIAVQSVLSAWKDYLARYNDGRGIVLIGHSQGSFVLERLISKYVEPDAAVRARVVSVILLGGDVMVPAGKDAGGTFKDLTACRSASQISCVIAYSSFDHTPPSDSLFGRAPSGSHVLCTNPAALAGGSGAIDPYFPTKRMNSVISFATLPGVATEWVNYPDLFTAQCESDGGVTRLQITDIRKPGDDRPKLVDALGPTWGLHLYDGNIALGNLVGIVQSEATAYAAKG